MTSHGADPHALSDEAGNRGDERRPQHRLRPEETRGGVDGGVDRQRDGEAAQIDHRELDGLRGLANGKKHWLYHPHCGSDDACEGEGAGEGALARETNVG